MLFDMYKLHMLSSSNLCPYVGTFIVVLDITLGSVMEVDKGRWKEETII